MKRPQSTQIQQQHTVHLSHCSLWAVRITTRQPYAVCAAQLQQPRTKQYHFNSYHLSAIPESSSECQSSTPQDCVGDPDSVTLDQTWLSGRFSRIMRTTAVVCHSHLPLTMLEHRSFTSGTEEPKKSNSSSAQTQQHTAGVTITELSWRDFKLKEEKKKGRNWKHKSHPVWWWLWLTSYCLSIIYWKYSRT